MNEATASRLARASVAAVLALSALATLPSAAAGNVTNEDCVIELLVAPCRSETFDGDTGESHNQCTYVRDTSDSGNWIGYCQYPGDVRPEESNTCVSAEGETVCDGGYGFCLAGRSDCDAPCANRNHNLCAKPGPGGPTYCLRQVTRELVCDGGRSYCLVTQTQGCLSPCSGATVDGQETCVTSCPPGEQGVVLNGDGTCFEHVFGSCTGQDNGLVVLDEPVCFRLCDAGYGLVLNGDAECHTIVPCPGGTYGVQVDGSGCHTVTLCPSGQVGAHVDSTGLCVPYSIPTVDQCPGGSYGIVLNGDPECHTVAPCPGGTYGVAVNGWGCHTVAPCPANTVGVAVDGSGCHTVEVCSGDTLGVKVDGSGCVENTVTDACPNGRKGIVVNGEEICPLA